MCVHIHWGGTLPGSPLLPVVATDVTQSPCGAFEPLSRAGGTACAALQLLQVLVVVLQVNLKVKKKLEKKNKRKGVAGKSKGGKKGRAF